MESSGEEDEKAEWNYRYNGDRGGEEKGKPPLPTTFKSTGTIRRASQSNVVWPPHAKLKTCGNNCTLRHR
jgi:hypothetical protein